MSGKSIEISIVIPAYNEAENIRGVVNRSKTILDTLTKDFEILVVNDGSVDETGKICEGLSRDDQRIRVIHHQRNLGIGAALKTLFKNAKGKLIFFIPADGQQDPREVTNFLEAINDCDIVCGYREERVDPFYRTLNSKLWNVWVRCFFGLKIKDIAWVKMYRRKVFEEIILDADSAFIDSEILIKAKGKGLRIREIPTGHFPRRHGRQSGNNPLVVLRAFEEFFQFYNKLRNL